MDTKICSKCNEEKPLEKFRPRHNQCKTCDYNRTKCEHGKVKKHCYECGGSGFCVHKKQKYSCKECNKSLCCGICKTVQVAKDTKFYPLCEACFVYENPDSELSNNYKIKERYMYDELRKRLMDTNIKMIRDKKIEGGVSRKRPDILIENYLFPIIIECDENQHKDYTDEDIRMMQLYNDLNKNVVIIRFNPDSYIDSNHKQIDGCFQDVKDIYQKKFYNVIDYEWKRRIDVLESIVRKYLILDEAPNKEVTIEYLFYDSYLSNRASIIAKSPLNDIKGSYIVDAFLDVNNNMYQHIIKKGNDFYIKYKPTSSNKLDIIYITRIEFENAST